MTHSKIVGYLKIMFFKPKDRTTLPNWAVVRWYVPLNRSQLCGLLLHQHVPVKSYWIDKPKIYAIPIHTLLSPLQPLFGAAKCVVTLRWQKLSFTLFFLCPGRKYFRRMMKTNNFPLFLHRLLTILERMSLAMQRRNMIEWESFLTTCLCYWNRIYFVVSASSRISSRPYILKT